MGDAMDKDGICFKCENYEINLRAYPCNECTRAFSGMQKDHFQQDALHHLVEQSQEIGRGYAVENVSINPSQDLAEAHWGYVEDLLMAHQVKAELVDNAKFHYISAFIHGYKHAVEDLANERT